MDAAAFQAGRGDRDPGVRAQCRLPGCPPLETVIAFWENDKRHHFKLFKPVAQVALDDLPFTWMKSELIVPDDFSCECC